MSNNSKKDILINRQAQLQTRLKEMGYDALILNPSPSLTYLTGMEFHLTERPVVGIFTVDKPFVIVVPELEAMKTDGWDYPIEVCSYPEEPSTWPAAFQRAIKAAGLGKAAVAVEALSIRMLELKMLEDALPIINMVPAEELVASLRMQKDADELAQMRRATDIAQKALESAIPTFRVGMTEREAAAEIAKQLFQHGSGTTLPFPPIVSSGPNGANPHAFPSERQLAEGDFIVIDWGANVNGYYSDVCRTFAVGEVDEEYAKIHKIVQEANGAARAIVKPGVTCHEVDKAARDIIEQAGYGEYFIHRTGHGLGMEIHEAPYMRANNAMVLEPGMTFTIEPGIYLPGRAGVRIEDDVVVTEDGIESLTDMDRGMRRVG